MKDDMKDDGMDDEYTIVDDEPQTRRDAAEVFGNGLMIGADPERRLLAVTTTLGGARVATVMLTRDMGLHLINQLMSTYDRTFGTNVYAVATRAMAENALRSVDVLEAKGEMDRRSAERMKRLIETARDVIVENDEKGDE